MTDPTLLSIPDMTHWRRRLPGMQGWEPDHVTAARAMAEGGWERVRVAGRTYRRERDTGGVATGRAVLCSVD